MWQVMDNGMVFSADDWRIRVDNSGVITVSTSDRDIHEITFDDYGVSIAGRSGGEGGYWGVDMTWKVMEALVAARQIARAAGTLKESR
jgi:hypothetical protein